MNTAEQLITNFYTAFNQRNAAAMNACYSGDIVFFDPVFELLRGDQVRAMWEMLCHNAKDFSLTFGNIQDLGDDYYTCDWVATYTFSKTGRKVINNVRANMKIVNGEIIEHSDAFSLHKWSTQALGFSGWLLGWNKFFQRKIKNTARKGLMKWMEKN
ncbi:nuclear transport factor 2 family protein [Ferruginibacter sp. HRS2-29]|uniref:nuclear transport factor 2 family protein n=1 Tax=Ferruginibacter sp. HRS2-29 TaxID=2487334 RepID=UPI0020CDACFE|nr:nuclear transport factor 2 family protein [Ferruginibacter sp. HRS2-29]MCP9751119.1 nuclear transport factor 2 family protein [Ferruginibacter sp. HRS2-29]